MPFEEIRDERIRKLKELQRSGGTAYPAETMRTHTAEEVLQKFSALAKRKEKPVLAGRVLAKREHGGSMFLDLRDGTAKIQIYLKEDVLEDEYQKALEVLDIGDFLEIEGRPFKTKKGEPTLEVSRWRMLAKSLRPLPEKWHGLQDAEERFRKRYLDLLMNEEVRRRFELRSEIVNALRGFHEENGFLEVETPTLHPLPGGALARPFKTYHNALGTEFYLRIAKELYLKRLLVGGLERVFEIGKDFRNEGIDATHSPEFTMLECYAAYWDEEKMMKFVEDVFTTLARQFGKKGAVSFQGQEIKFKKPFPRIAFAELLKRYALITDYEAETRDSMATRARQLGIDTEPHESKGKIADEIYKKICRPHLIQPTFVTNHPIDISPLAKSQGLTLAEKGRILTARRFQLIAGGMELTNGFAELNDPLDQRERFEEQEKNHAGGEEGAHRLDEDYLEAMEYGMPPAAGLGIGIDRVVMLFTDTKNMREVVFFPTMKSK